MSHTGSLFTLWIALSQSQDTARQTTGAAHAHATDRQRRESANTKSTHYFISKLQSTLPQRKEYEQGITTMEDDEELMTVEISALLCSIISQGTKNDEKYRIRRQLRRCPARRGGRSATCACRVSSRIFRNVLLYSSRGALTPTGQLEDNAEDNRIRVRNDAPPINNPMAMGLLCTRMPLCRGSKFKLPPAPAHALFEV